MKGLLLLLSLALTTVGVLGGRNLDHVSNEGLHNCADAGDEEYEAKPPVPYDCCEHGFQTSESERIRRLRR